MKNVFIDGPIGKLDSTLHMVNESRDGLVICHPHPLYGGTKDNKVVTTIANAAQALGMNVVRFNYRGVGASEGEYAEIEGEVQDAITVAKWLMEQIPLDRLFFAGFSFGSYIAAQAAKQLSGIIEVPHILIVAPSVLHSPFEQALPLISPSTIIMGDADEVVPYDQVVEWSKQLEQNTFITMPETSHFFHRKLIDLREHINTTYTPYMDS
jgi:alpha/beta superfamily hydrolase